MTEKNEVQLIKEYLGSNEEALKILIQKYLKPIYGFVFRLVCNAAEAEDVVQNTFIKMWKNLKKFDPNKNFKTWLFTIAKNTAFDSLKKKKPLLFSEFTNDNGENILEKTLADIEPLPDEILERQDAAKIIENAMKGLPVNYQTVLNLHYNENLTLKEIAEILNKSENTIKSWHRRALNKLKELVNLKAQGL